MTTAASAVCSLKNAISNAFAKAISEGMLPQAELPEGYSALLRKKSQRS